MIETRDRVKHAYQMRRSNLLLLIVTSRDEKRATHSPRVHLAVIDDHPHLRITHDKGRTEPLLVPLTGQQLSGKQVLGNTTLESLLVLALQAVRCLPHRQPRNINIVLKALQCSARAALDPEGTAAPLHGLLKNSAICNGKMRKLLRGRLRTVKTPYLQQALLVRRRQPRVHRHGGLPSQRHVALHVHGRGQKVATGQPRGHKRTHASSLLGSARLEGPLLTGTQARNFLNHLALEGLQNHPVRPLRIAHTRRKQSGPGREVLVTSRKRQRLLL